MKWMLLMSKVLFRNTFTLQTNSKNGTTPIEFVAQGLGLSKECCAAAAYAMATSTGPDKRSKRKGRKWKVLGSVIASANTAQAFYSLQWALRENSSINGKGAAMSSLINTANSIGFNGASTIFEVEKKAAQNWKLEQGPIWDDLIKAAEVSKSGEIILGSVGRTDHMIVVRRSERDGVWWALDVTRDQQVVGKWSRNVGHLIAEITRANKADALQAAIL